MSKNVIKLSDVLNDGTKYSVSDMLEEALERAEELKIKKAIVIFWDESETDLGKMIKWHQCGLKKREQLYLLTMAKQDFELDFNLSHTHD